MGGRRAGSKRIRTPLVSNSIKTRNDSYSPPPLHAAQLQRAEPPSPDRQMSGESYFSDSTSTLSILSNQPPSLSPTTNHSKQNNSGGS